MTEGKKTQETLVEDIDALRRSEERLRLALTVASDGYWDWNVRTGEVFFSPRWLETLGYEPGDLEPHVDSWKRLVHPDDMPRVTEALDAHFEGKTPIYACENRLRTKTGVYRWNLDRGRVVSRDADGRPLRMVGIDADITLRKQAEEALRDSRERYQLLFNHMTEGFALHEIICDENGRPDDYRFLAVNPSFEKLTRLKGKDIIGKTVREVLPTIESHWIETYGNVALTGEPTSFENYAEPLDRHFRVSAFCPRRGQFAAIFTDTTEQVRVSEALREREERFRATFNWAGVGMALVDMEGRPRECNAALTRMLGYSEDELRGMVFTEFTHPDDADKDVALYKELIAGKRRHYAMAKRYIRKDGRTIWGRLNVSLVREAGGQPQYAIGMVEDISEQKQAEEELRKLNVELEERVLERTAELEASNKELEAFSYSVSHDLRAPLRHMTGFVSLLEQHAGSSMDEKARRYAKIIADSAGRMGRLIDDLLDFSRTGRTQLEKTSINLTALVKDVQRECLRDAQGRQIDWKLDPLPKVAADRSLLRLVLMNLLSNALKFTRGRSQASIHVGAMPADDDTAVVFVRDNGAGFDKRYAGKLFGVFQRLHTSDEDEGTGIGLANVRRIIHRHGGQVWAESAVDQGATFYFSLPKSNGGAT